MEIHFKSAHTADVEKEVTLEITSKTQRKLLALKKYLGKTDAPTQVYVELGRATEAHLNGEVWRTQINLDLRGKRYHTDKTAETLLASIDMAVKDLEAELRKAKQKHESLLRQGGSLVKSIMRGFKAP